MTKEERVVEWRDIPSLPEYFASSRGSLKCKVTEKRMPHGGTRKYGGVEVWGVVHEGNSSRPTILFRGKNYRVSRLICEAFHGPAPFPRAVVMHVDDNPSNNRPENLRWATQKENLNAQKFIEYCRSRTGERHPRAIHRRRKLELVA
jgi:hypothetical protein